MGHHARYFTATAVHSSEKFSTPFMCSISTRVEHSQAVLVRPPQFISDEKLGLETAVNDTIAWFDASPEHSKEKFEAKLKSSLLTELPRNSIESLGQTNLP